MKAIVYDKYGPPEVLQLQEVEKPAPKDNEVLVKVNVVSLNAADLEYLRGTAMIRMGGLLKPKHKILGSDIAGRVETVGKNVKQFQPGDEVFGDLFYGGFGAFAEYVCVPENALALKPTSMSFEEVVTLPQSGLLAMQGLRDKRQIQPGQKILINGAGGGTGTFAVQIAKSFGAEVTGVDSTSKLDMVRSIGADQVIDYMKEDYTKSGQRYDLILDMKGNRSTLDYKRALHPGGTFIMVGGSWARLFQLLLLGSLISIVGSKKMGFLAYKPNKDLALLMDLIEAGKVVPIIDKRYPLSEVAEALQYLGEGHVRGKVVITMEHDNET